MTLAINGRPPFPCARATLGLLLLSLRGAARRMVGKQDEAHDVGKVKGSCVVNKITSKVTLLSASCLPLFGSLSRLHSCVRHRRGFCPCRLSLCLRSYVFPLSNIALNRILVNILGPISPLPRVEVSEGFMVGGFYNKY